MSSFHSSSRRSDELPKSPFQTFVDVLRDELRKNRELQENVKQLQGDVENFQDSEAMRKARAAYERARLTSSIKENPRLRAAAEELKKRGVGQRCVQSVVLRSDVQRALGDDGAVPAPGYATRLEGSRHPAVGREHGARVRGRGHDAGGPVVPRPQNIPSRSPSIYSLFGRCPM
ncbi:hypothetical protein EDB86DRAFT_258258 [Lactarius hatsudake]|nr:hypothetical protein EDB86DRAFT_258258 [Lactarius hatsudake]